MNPKFKIPRKKSSKKTTKSKVVSNSKKIKELVKSVNATVENKIQKFNGVYVDSPKSQQPSFTGPLYLYNACLGTGASTWLGPQGTPNFTDLQGFTWGQGVQSDQRIGRYLFLKHTTMNMRIGMNSVPKMVCPTQFRIVVFKAKRNAAFGSSGGNPNADLFLNNDGTAIGVNVASAVETRTFEFMNMLVNKRNYEVHTDKKIILQPSNVTVQGSASIVTPFSTKYPPEATFQFKLPHNTKAAFPPGNFGEPLDLNYQYCVQVIAAPLGSTTAAADDWHISFRGTVSCVDS